VSELGSEAIRALDRTQRSDAMGIRIWHQSMTDLTLLPGYAAMLQDHVRLIGAPDTTVDLHGLTPGTYPEGMAPIDMVRYRWAHHLAFVQIVENVMRAQREGYDAVAVSCFVDPALEEARSVVDIPVVSSLETALLVSSTIGRAFGLLTIHESMARTLREIVQRYGFAERVVAVEAMDPPIREFELDEAFAGSPELVERFAAQARRMVAAGCDVIIPAEGVVNTVLVRNKLHSVDGTPVLDSYGALLAFAEMLVQLRRRSGLAVGRRGIYAQPPDSLVRHLRRITREALRD
jgi:Asp/Glu/hydantoin racemase